MDFKVLTAVIDVADAAFFLEFTASPDIIRIMESAETADGTFVPE